VPLIDELLARAASLRARGELEAAAATLDVAARQDRAALRALQEVLDQLAVTEHGLTFRYVPAGTFQMGAEDGEPDERPVHEVSLPGYWVSDVPLSWDAVTGGLGWPQPPAEPTEEQWEAVGSLVSIQICLQYCEDKTVRARDWHAHATPSTWTQGGTGKEISSEEIFGRPERSSDEAYRYATKPMVAVEWAFAARVGERLSSASVQYRLPTEAEWERAARGCFPAAAFPWGDAPPAPERADFDRFDAFSILPSRSFAPNDYGLHAMAGGVWEWCADEYDATFYQRSPRESPLCRRANAPKEVEHVLRGGSWADCADVLRTSFRSSSPHGSAPNVGFRLVRVPRRG
jgi:formylglycine-generating enzyme required for sulfatase activity